MFALGFTSILGPRRGALAALIGATLHTLFVGGEPDMLLHPEDLQALGGIPLLHTDWHGWIELSTYGEGMWVEVEGKGIIWVTNIG